MDWAKWANTVASALVALAAAGFVTTYELLAPWRRSAAGRHIMTFSASVGALGLYTVAVTVWPHGPAATVLRVVRVVLLLALAALLVQRTVMVVRAQREPGREDGR